MINSHFHWLKDCCVPIDLTRGGEVTFSAIQLALFKINVGLSFALIDIRLLTFAFHIILM